jgi:hypothetical protein
MSRLSRSNSETDSSSKLGPKASILKSRLRHRTSGRSATNGPSNVQAADDAFAADTIVARRTQGPVVLDDAIVAVPHIARTALASLTC